MILLGIEYRQILYFIIQPHKKYLTRGGQMNLFYILFIGMPSALIAHIMLVYQSF